MPPQRQAALWVLLLATALCATTACGGSAISPEAAMAANARVLGQLGANGTTGGADVPNDGAPVTAPGTGGTAGGGATSGTGAGSATGAVGGSGSGTNVAAGSAVKAGSCAGFKNQTGITSDSILLGNAADVSGPVPGLFTASQQATKAYVAYFNATNSSGICGRKLSLQTYDSRTDAGADQEAYQKMCDSVFAAVGSMSAFDSGGAPVAQSCGLPDLRTAAVTAARSSCSTCFGAQSTGPHEFTNGVPDFFVKNDHAASQKAAFLYLNAGAAAENAKTQQAVEEKRGMKFVYSSGIDVSEFNYGAYVQQLKSKGVRWVQFLGAYQQAVRMAQAMQQAAYKPDVFMVDPGSYDQQFIKTGGSAVEGAILYINFVPLEEHQPELDVYKKWLQQVAPGAEPSFFGMFAWSAAKLFVERSRALGGRLTRSSLVASLRGVTAWTGGGMHAAMPVGPKHLSSCIRFLQVKGGRFVPYAGTKYRCDGYSTS